MKQDPDPKRDAHLAFRHEDRDRLGPLGPRKDAVQARSRETVDVILEAAAQVFERGGCAAATTDRIAERAGVSVGSVYQYWPSKDAIAIALMERHAEAHLALLRPALRALGDRALPLEARLEGLVRALVDVHGARPDLHWTLEAEAHVPLPYRERIGELTRQLAATLAESLGIDPDRALLVACALEALPHALIRPSTRMPAEASVREITRMILGYVRS